VNCVLGDDVDDPRKLVRDVAQRPSPRRNVKEEVLDLIEGRGAKRVRGSLRSGRKLHEARQDGP
jgi:hypothetical protein